MQSPGPFLRRFDCGEDLLLLGAELARLEGRRLFHRGQRQKLHEVVLDHVSGDADAIEVAGSPTDTDVLGHGDLDMIDIVVVPHRLEQLVREAKRQHVLNRFLAEVVIDAKHR